MSFVCSLFGIALLFIFNCSIGQEVKPLNIKGLVAAVFSPFDSESNLNLSVVAQQAAFLNSTGVKYAFVAGTTGESVSLSQEEREQLLEKWISIAPIYNLNIIVHVGANCVHESRALVHHAVSLNSTSLVAFASMSTSFFKPASIKALIELMSDIASAAPQLPFYYYHIPSMTGVEFNMYDFMTKAIQHIDNLVGIKYTGLYYHDSSFPDVLKILNYNDNGKRIEVLTGRDEMMIQCLVSGVVGFVGSQYNFAGELYNNIITEYNNGNADTYRSLQLDAWNLLLQVEFNVTTGNNGAKHLMVEAGVNVGDARPPYLKMDQDDKQKEEQNTLMWCQQTNDALSWCKNLRKRLNQ